MEPFLIIFLILIGTSFRFAYYLFTRLSKDDSYKVFKTDAPGGVNKLQLEEINHTIFFVELFCYLLSNSALFSLMLHLSVNSGLYWIISGFGLFVSIAGIRFFISILSKKIKNKALIRFVPFIRFFFRLCMPLRVPVRYFHYKLNVIHNEENSLEDLDALVESARAKGSIEAEEYRILKNIMHFSDVLVSDVMTPRTVVFSCLTDDTIEQAIKRPELKMYSRFPLRDGASLDEGISGYVMTKDILLEALFGDKNKKLKELAREVYYIPENAELDNALDAFLERRQHLLMVVDEYGGIEGLITMEDVLETILGVEIVDEADRIVDLRELAKKKRDKRISNQNLMR